MGNICITSYAFKGNRKQNDDLMENLRKLYHEENNKVGNFLDKLGAVGETNFKGRVIFEDFDGETITFSVESDWGRIPFIDEFLEAKYIGSVVLYLEDCLESDIFCTNDKNQDHFKTRYAYDDEYIGLDYYEDEESVLKAFNETLAWVLAEKGEKLENPCTDIEELENIAEENDMWVSLHKIEYV